MQGFEKPTEGEILAVHGPNPGPWSGMSFDVGARMNGAPIRFQNAQPSNPGPDDYDVEVVRGPDGWPPCAISWRGETARFWIPWLPVVEEC